MNFSKEQLRKLNSMTKYPSIPTYHNLGDKGILLPSHVEFPSGQQIIATEKIDGTNSRIIVIYPNDIFLGSREELLHMVGDVIYNPSEGIVDTILPRIKAMDTSALYSYWFIVVYYMETYGGSINGAKNYSSSKQTSVRLFDAMYITCNSFVDLMTWPLERIALYREDRARTFQHFATEDELQQLSKQINVQLTPRLGVFDGIPDGLTEMHRLLTEMTPETLCALDKDAKKKSEGIVFRTPDRLVIAKARFEDYERTFRSMSNK